MCCNEGTSRPSITPEQFLWLCQAVGTINDRYALPVECNPINPMPTVQSRDVALDIMRQHDLTLTMSGDNQDAWLTAVRAAQSPY